MSDRERRAWLAAVCVLLASVAGLSAVCVGLAGALAATTGG